MQSTEAGSERMLWERLEGEYLENVYNVDAVKLITVNMCYFEGTTSDN